MHRIPVNLLGVSMTLQTEENPEKILKVVEYFQNKLDEVSKTLKDHDSLKLSLVTGLILAEEILFHVPLPQGDLEKIAQNLIDRIDQVL